MERQKNTEDELEAPFRFEGFSYYYVSYMSAWVYYNYATNYRSKKMNGKQYWIWRKKMYEEGKDDFFYD